MKIKKKFSFLNKYLARIILFSTKHLVCKSSSIFYLKIINIMTMLPPIIIKVVGSKFFIESIRLETFELMSVLVFVVDVVGVVVVVVRGSSMPGSAVWVAGICAY